MDSFALLPTTEVTPLDFLDPNQTGNPSEQQRATIYFHLCQGAIGK